MNATTLKCELPIYDGFQIPDEVEASNNVTTWRWNEGAGYLPQCNLRWAKIGERTVLIDNAGISVTEPDYWHYDSPGFALEIIRGFLSHIR